MQGQDATDVDAVAALNTKGAKLSAKERALLEYVKVLTQEPSKVRDTHTESLRKAGWSDEQIFEASFITSLFAFTNRMADAYGLDYPSGGWQPPAQRQPEAAVAPSTPATSTNAQPASAAAATQSPNSAPDTQSPP